MTWRGVAFTVFQTDFAAEDDLRRHRSRRWCRAVVPRTARCCRSMPRARVDVAVGETEAVFASAEQQGGVEVGAADHGGYRRAPDGEVLALWGTLTQMVTGGGEDLVGVGEDTLNASSILPISSRPSPVFVTSACWRMRPVSSSSQVHVSFTHCSTSSAVTVTVGIAWARRPRSSTGSRLFRPWCRFCRRPRFRL